MAPEDGARVWPAYYHAIAGRAPRPLLAAVLRRWEAAAGGPLRSAVDLGCGDGTETLVLLQQGWRVLAVDSEPAAIAAVRARVAPGDAARLDTQVASFEAVRFPAVDLMYAGLSLFFCDPGVFPEVWARIGAAIVPGGRFAGHLLGDRDTWAGGSGYTAHTAAQARQLFQGFTVESFEEVENDRPAFSGPKHWHVFEIIARKASAPS
jgi:SAM-dependent methyltransferase